MNDSSMLLFQKLNDSVHEQVANANDDCDGCDERADI